MISCPRERQARSLQTKRWHKAGESVYSWSRTVKLYCWPYGLVDFPNRYGEKKALPDQQLHTRYQRMLICPSKATASGTAAVIVKLTITHCHSPRPICLLHRPDRWTEWGCGEKLHPFILQAFDGGTISTSPPETWHCFWFTISLDRDRSSGFHLFFPSL